MNKADRAKKKADADDNEQKASKNKKKTKRKKRNEVEAMSPGAVGPADNDTGEGTAGDPGLMTSQEEKNGKHSNRRQRSLSGLFRRSGDSNKRTRSVSGDRAKSKSRDKKKRNRSLENELERDLAVASEYADLDPVLFPRERLRRMTVREALVDSRVRGRSPNRGLSRLERKVLDPRDSLSSSLPQIFQEGSEDYHTGRQGDDYPSGTSTLPNSKKRRVVSADRVPVKLRVKNDYVSPVTEAQSGECQYPPLDKRKYIIDKERSQAASATSQRTDNDAASTCHSATDLPLVHADSSPNFLASEKSRRQSFTQFLQLRDRPSPVSTSSAALGKAPDSQTDDYRPGLSAIEEPHVSGHDGTDYCHTTSQPMETSIQALAQEEKTEKAEHALQHTMSPSQVENSSIKSKGDSPTKEENVVLVSKPSEKQSKRLFRKSKLFGKSKKGEKGNSENSQHEKHVSKTSKKTTDSGNKSAETAAESCDVVGNNDKLHLDISQPPTDQTRKTVYVSPRSFSRASRTSQNSQTSNKSEPVTPEVFSDQEINYNEKTSTDDAVKPSRETEKFKKRYTRSSERRRRNRVSTDTSDNVFDAHPLVEPHHQGDEAVIIVTPADTNHDKGKTTSEEQVLQEEGKTTADANDENQKGFNQLICPLTDASTQHREQLVSMKDRKRSFQIGDFGSRVPEGPRRASEPAFLIERASQTEDFPTLLSCETQISPIRINVDADCQTDSVEIIQPIEEAKATVIQNIVRSFSEPAQSTIQNNGVDAIQSHCQYLEPEVVNTQHTVEETVISRTASEEKVGEEVFEDAKEIQEPPETPEIETDKKEEAIFKEKPRRSIFRSKKRSKKKPSRKSSNYLEPGKKSSSLKKASSLSDLTPKKHQPVDHKPKRAKGLVAQRSRSEEDITQVKSSLQRLSVEDKKSSRKSSKDEQLKKDENKSRPAGRLTFTGVITLKQRLARIRKARRKSDPQKKGEQEDDAKESSPSGETGVKQETSPTGEDVNKSGSFADSVTYENELNVSLDKIAVSQDNELADDELIEKSDQVYMKKIHFDPYACDNISDLTEEELIRQRQKNTRLCSRRESKVRQRQKRVISCCKKFVAFMFSHIGLCSLVVAYCIFGGFIFKELEGKAEIIKKAEIAELRQTTRNSIWNLAFDMNLRKASRTKFQDDIDEILRNYSIRIQKETKESGWDGKDVKEVPEQWSFPSSLLYAITVMTTIGYGHVAPKTDYGRIVTIGYAVLGIPLTLLCLTNIGDVMAHGFRMLYGKVCCGLCCVLFRPSRRKVPDPEKGIAPGEERMMMQEEEKSQEVIHVPTSLCILLMASYVLLGTLMFSKWEGWDFITGTYFCFITLSTIGFGDVVPGTDTDNWDKNEKLVLCAMYLIFGLSLIAMCFNLVQEDVKAKCRWLGTKLGIIEKPVSSV